MEESQGAAVPCTPNRKVFSNWARQNHNGDASLVMFSHYDRSWTDRQRQNGHSIYHTGLQCAAR